MSGGGNHGNQLIGPAHLAGLQRVGQFTQAVGDEGRMNDVGPIPKHGDNANSAITPGAAP